MSVNTIIIIDVQGFKLQNNQFILKELAILTSENQVQHYIFQPPFPYKDLTRAEKRQVRWLQYNFHGFRWGDGNIPYNRIYGIADQLLLLLQDKIIYVKGSEKKQWVEQIFGNKLIVYDAEEEGCPNLTTEDKIEPSCIVHKGRCALKNVFFIKNFF